MANDNLPSPRSGEIMVEVNGRAYDCQPNQLRCDEADSCIGVHMGDDAEAGRLGVVIFIQAGRDGLRGWLPARVARALASDLLTYAALVEAGACPSDRVQ